MTGRLRRLLSGEGLGARARRATLISLGQMAAGQGLRFVSNVVLAWLLFPEAFGLMAIVQAVLGGVALASTFGLDASVVQSKRGDDPVFLDTVWSLQMLRGVLLWGVVWLAAGPVAGFYGQPPLAQLLPLCAVSLVVQGLNPTSVLVNERHMRLGWITAARIATQAASLVLMALLAWWTGSVFALAAGYVAQPAMLLALYWLYLPGRRDRFGIERRAAGEILSLGKYLFVSSIATYALMQSDRAILGATIPIDLLGLYSIALALATLPGNFSKGISKKVFFPLLRERHPADSREDGRRIFRARRAIAAGAIAASAVAALAGPWLIDLLYDDRYRVAGAIIVLLAGAGMPGIVATGMLHAVLVRGDSLWFMIANVGIAALQVAIMIPASAAYGVPGAALAIASAPVLAYPLVALALRRHACWDWRGDLMLSLGGAALMGAAAWLHAGRLAELAG